MAGQNFSFSIILIFIITLSVFSCSTDNSITESDQSLGKTTEELAIYSTGSGDVDEDAVNEYIAKLVDWIIERYKNTYLFKKIGDCADASFNRDPADYSAERTLKLYDFRDNYLSLSHKGETYIACYYLLSKYGVENNLINEYYKEHYKLLKNSAFAARDLQHGTDNNQIIVNDEFAEDLKEILAIYRNHPNHKDIDPVLDYLEYDLKKYQNKPKSVIAKDFK